MLITSLDLLIYQVTIFGDVYEMQILVVRNESMSVHVALIL